MSDVIWIMKACRGSPQATRCLEKHPWPRKMRFHPRRLADDRSVRRFDFLGPIIPCLLFPFWPQSPPGSTPIWIVNARSCRMIWIDSSKRRDLIVYNLVIDTKCGRREAPLSHLPTCQRQIIGLKQKLYVLFQSSSICNLSVSLSSCRSC